MAYFNFDLALTSYTKNEADKTETFKVYVADTSDQRSQIETNAETIFMDDGFRKTARQLANGGLDPQETLAFAFDLGRKLFPPLVREQLMRCYEKCADAGDTLRIRLRINHYALMTLPWEFVWLEINGTTTANKDNRGYLARDKRISIVRYEAIDTNTPKLKAQNKPLRLLALFSNPADAAQLNLQEEEDKLKAVLDNQGGAVQASYEHDVRVEVLQDKLLNPPDILHFSGHGEFDESANRGYLLFMRKGGDKRRVAIDELTPLLTGNSIRLVVLNACEGGKRDGVNPFTGVAPALVRAGIPAVIAMQFKVADQAAIAFSSFLYKALLSGKSLEEAVTQARLNVANMAEEYDDDQMRREWGVPQVYLHGESDLKISGGAGGQDLPETQAVPVVIANGNTMNYDLNDPVDLRNAIMKICPNKEELEVLCQDLTSKIRKAGEQMDQDITSDILGGDGLQIRVLKLIQYVKARSWDAYLIQLVGQRLNPPKAQPTKRNDAPIDLSRWTTAKVRKLLSEGLSETQLTSLAYDNFREAHDSFGNGMGKSDKITKLIEYVDAQVETERLLRFVREINPKKFEQIATQP